jgi:hypothetical protein
VAHTELPELLELQALAEQAGPLMTQQLLCSVTHGPQQWPVHAYTLGRADAALPAVAFIGGVHGLERIGAEVVIAYLRSLVMRLRWDDSLHRMLDSVRLLFVPLLNPGGLALGTRANPQGVDLMRNAPVDAQHGAPFLLGGHRVSAKLPWYRGPEGAPMQMESQALCDVVQRELLGRPFSIAVDCHSGFGLIDRIWFPFAHTTHPITHLPELHALGELTDQSLLHHRYVIEPQSRQYLAHGDLWDHLYLQATQQTNAKVFLPLTLEMGSWMWIKKNPRQLFSRHGIFNPLIEHRQQRVLRRHLGWLDLVTRAAASHQRWLPEGVQRQRHHDLALARWYGRT